MLFQEQRKQTSMNGNVYHFGIGRFECAVVNDGTFPYPQPSQLLFANAPSEQLAPFLEAHGIDADSWTEWVSCYPALLVNTGEELVLVDTGAGDFAPSTGRLIPQLRELDITPEDIGTVILTHGHPDHIGGAVNVDGEPAFPNARYVMAREEWAFWRSEPDLSSLQIGPHFIEVIRTVAQAKLPPLQDRMTLVDDGDEIVAGISVIAAPGHTPGHLALAIRSDGEELLYGSDVLVHPIHVEHPDWTTALDYSPSRAVVTRRKLLGRAAVDGVLVHSFHFPFPGLGRVVLEGAGWQWRSSAPVKL